MLNIYLCCDNLTVIYMSYLLTRLAVIQCYYFLASTYASFGLKYSILRRLASFILKNGRYPKSRLAFSHEIERSVVNKRTRCFINDGGCAGLYTGLSRIMLMRTAALIAL